MRVKYLGILVSRRAVDYREGRLVKTMFNMQVDSEHVIGEFNGPIPNEYIGKKVSYQIHTKRNLFGFRRTYHSLSLDDTNANSLVPQMIFDGFR